MFHFQGTTGLYSVMMMITGEETTLSTSNTKTRECMSPVISHFLYTIVFLGFRYLVATHNQFGRPISGQREICALSSQGSESLWQAMVIEIVCCWYVPVQDNVIFMFCGRRGSI